MSIHTLVLDFDGTLTNINEESIPIVEGWKKDVARQLKVSDKELESLWAEQKSKILANPDKYGWERDGKFVAPACIDPLVLATTINGLLFDRANMYMGGEERKKILYETFKANYSKGQIRFQEGANDFLAGVVDAFNVCIVTNSGTEEVSKKIRQLPGNFQSIPIYGDAKKYDLNPNFTTFPEYVTRPGFNRPLYLRREKYWRVLEKIMTEQHISPENVCVMGDVYELDLLVPEHVGMSTILAVNENTSQSERNAVSSSKNGKVAYSLGEAIKHIRYY